MVLALSGLLGTCLGVFFLLGASVILYLWLHNQPPIEFNKHNPPKKPKAREWNEDIADDEGLPPFTPVPIPPIPIADGPIEEEPPLEDIVEPILDEIPEELPEENFPHKEDEKFMPPAAEYEPPAEDYDILDTWSDDGGGGSDDD